MDPKQNIEYVVCKCLGFAMEIIVVEIMVVEIIAMEIIVVESIGVEIIVVEIIVEIILVDTRVPGYQGYQGYPRGTPGVPGVPLLFKSFFATSLATTTGDGQSWGPKDTSIETK